MKRLFLVLMMGCVILSCQKTREEKTVTDEFQQTLDLEKLVAQTPRSPVSSTATLDIKFKESVAPDHLAGTALDQNPFVFDPALKGRTEWVSSSWIRFTPQSPMKPGVTYKGTLKGNTAFGAQKKATDFHFSFKVAEQEVLGLDGDFDAAEGGNNRVVYQGSLRFAQQVELGRIEKDLDFKGPDGNVRLTLTSGNGGRTVTVRSAAIPRRETGQTFTFTLPGKYRADGEKWVKTVYLAGGKDMSVIAHMDLTDPDADKSAYGFRFSDPVKQDMDVSGYVTVDPPVAFEIQVKSKYLILRGDFLPGRKYTATLSAGLPSVFGTRLAEEYTAVFQLDNLKPEITWLSGGVYLPSDNAFKLQFKSVNVRKARIRVTEIFPQNLGFFIQQNAIEDRSSRPREYEWERSEYTDLERVGKEIYNEELRITGTQNHWNRTELDLSPVFKDKNNTAFVVQVSFDQSGLIGRCTNDANDVREGDLYFEREDYYSNPCDYGYYYSHGSLSKLLIASDIGLTVKKADDGVHVTATNVLTARPESGLELSVYSYQNEKLETRTTDGDGYARFEKNGFYIYGQTENGIALIRLDHQPWMLNNFDTGGGSGGQKGMDCFVYTDRGVYRPGDTVHLAAIIRSNRQAPPANLPVLLKVTNPRGQTVLERRTECGESGHVWFPIETNGTDPTGGWNAEIEVGGEKFEHTLRIETVKPNRLKIAMDVPEFIRPPETRIAGTVDVKYLFGTPAAGLSVRIRADLSGVPFTARPFADFQFGVPGEEYQEQSLTLLEGALDAEGKAAFSGEIPDLRLAPGLIRANLNTVATEKGGSFTERNTRLTIVPYPAFVGIKDMFGWRSAKTGQKASIPIVAVDPDGNPLSGRRLRIAVYLNRKYWWWHYDRNDRRDFKSLETTTQIKTVQLASESEPVSLTLDIEDEGQHLVEVTDVESGHSAGLFFWASSWGGMAREDETARPTLEMTTDKNTYSPGDQAVVTFKSPKKGLALLTVEQGGRILAKDQKAVTDSVTSFRIAVKEEMIPNCYVTMSLIQPHNQNTNDLPMRIYGVKPLTVENASTRLPLSMKAPGEIRPKETFTVKVTSNARTKASATIAVVDEGLLDLTDFKTPNPWNYFFQKIRLAVATLDNFDEILGTLFPDMDQFFTIGGGDDLMGSGREKRLDQSRVKRFVPVVLFQKPVTIEPGKTVETRFTMPNYVGSVRIMVVGCAGHSYAALEETIPVRQELMVLPTLPRVARPGDVFAVPVSVFAMDSAVQDVTLRIRTSENLKVSGTPETLLAFEKPGEKDAAFEVSVGNAVGADTVRIMAESGRFNADEEVHLPVTSPYPFFTEVTEATATKGNPVTLVPEKFGLDGTNSARLVVSRMPDIQIEKRIKDLIRYPYGCIEQTVSAAFPQLFLPILADLKPYQKQAVTDHINAAMTRLQTFKMSDGFSYWPFTDWSRQQYNDWGTSYLGHFLIEAKARGFHVPPDLYNHWLGDARSKAKQVNRDNHRYQAYRLYLLALAGEPQTGAMNLLRENYLSKLDPLSRKLLAAAYFLSGQKAVATQVDEVVPSVIKTERELGGTYGSPLRDLALMTTLTLKMEDLKTSAGLLKDLTAGFRPSGWYSTQETAMALLAIGTYFEKSPATGAIKFRLKRGGQKEESLTLANFQMAFDLSDSWSQPVTVTTDQSGPLFVTLLREGIPLDDRVRTESQGIDLVRQFLDEEGLPISVLTAKQGAPFWVVYTVRSRHAQNLENLALTSIFPSGWEIVNTRLDNTDPPAWIRKLRMTSGDYMDIRDDRVNWFFDLSPNRSIVLGVKINPSFKGSYTLPPVAVEAMYAPDYYAHIQSGKVRVE